MVGFSETGLASRRSRNVEGANALLVLLRFGSTMSTLSFQSAGVIGLLAAAGHLQYVSFLPLPPAWQPVPHKLTLSALFAQDGPLSALAKDSQNQGSSGCSQGMVPRYGRSPPKPSVEILTGFSPSTCPASLYRHLHVRYFR